MLLRLSSAASGVVGLVWSAHTACSAAEVRTAVSLTALDVGKKGRDDQFGYGIVQVGVLLKFIGGLLAM